MKKKTTVAIVDRSKEQCMQLETALLMNEHFIVVGTAHNGEYASRMIWEQLPDILILDMHLPYGDGFSVLNSIRGMIRKPVVIFTSAFLSSYVEKTARNMGVQYILQKPYSIPMLVKRMEDLINAALSDDILDPFITNALMQAGIPDHLLGYHYLQDAIKIAIRDKNAIQNPLEYIYIPLAEKYDTKHRNVTLSMEFAILLGSSRFDIVQHEIYSTDRISNANKRSNKGKYLTIGQFIDTLSNIIRLQLNVCLYAQPLKKDYKTEEMVASVLTELGTEKHLKGYIYLYDIILIAVRSDISLEKNIKTIYYDLGEKYNTSPYNIFQRTEMVIHRLLHNGNQTMIQKIFESNEITSKRQNVSFIAVISKYIRMRLDKQTSI